MCESRACPPGRDRTFTRQVRTTDLGWRCICTPLSGLSASVSCEKKHPKNFRKRGKSERKKEREGELNGAIG